MPIFAVFVERVFGTENPGVGSSILPLPTIPLRGADYRNPILPLCRQALSVRMHVMTISVKR
jgi:hypothetical protein